MAGFFFILVLVAIGVAIGYFLFPRNNAITVNGKLSGVGKAVVDAYNSLPPESRPFPDIVEIIKTLDEKTGYDPSDRRKHFDENWLEFTKVQLGGYKFSWKTRYCSHRSCEYAEYYSLFQTIEEVRESVRVKEKAILESKLSGNVDIIKDLESELRKEAGVNKEFVRKFKELE